MKARPDPLTPLMFIKLGINLISSRAMDSILLKLQGETIIDFAMETLKVFVRESELWHLHLGYISKRSLKILSEWNLLCVYVAKELNIFI